MPFIFARSHISPIHSHFWSPFHWPAQFRSLFSPFPSRSFASSTARSLARLPHRNAQLSSAGREAPQTPNLDGWSVSQKLRMYPICATADRATNLSRHETTKPIEIETSQLYFVLQFATCCCYYSCWLLCLMVAGGGGGGGLNCNRKSTNQPPYRITAFLLRYSSLSR